MDKLSGYKTYLIAALVAIVTGTLAADQMLHFLPADIVETLKWVLGLLGAGGVATLRAAMSKAEKKADAAAVEAKAAKEAAESIT